MRARGWRRRPSVQSGERPGGYLNTRLRDWVQPGLRLAAMTIASGSRPVLVRTPLQDSGDTELLALWEALAGQRR